MMELLPTLAYLSAIHLVMAMVPGPNTVVVSYCSVGMSRRAGLSAAFGIALASLMWVSASLAGIGALLVHAGDVFRLIRLAGALYLIYVGIRLLRSQPSATGTTSAPVYRSPFLAGLLTTLSNPKSAIFWTSVFAVVLPANPPAWFYGAVLTLIAVQAFFWYATVALALSSDFSRRHYERLGRALNRIAGACMLFFGLKIASDLGKEVLAATR